MDARAAERRVGPREVDVLEDAGGAATLRKRLRAVAAVLVDPHDLAGQHVADDLGADEVERARLGGDHPVVPDPPERQRPDAERVAEGDQRRRRRSRRRNTRPRGDASSPRRPPGTVPGSRASRAAITSVSDDEASCTPDCDQLVAQRRQVDEVPVVAEGDRARGAVVDDRLRVRPVHAAGRRVARVPDRDLSRERGELLLVEHLRHEAHLAQHRDAALALRDGDARPTPGRGAGARRARSTSTARRRARSDRTPKTPHIRPRLPHRRARARRARARRACCRRPCRCACTSTSAARRIGLDLLGRTATITWPPISPNSVERILVELERRADTAPERRLGERDGEAALGDVVDERRVSGGARRMSHELHLRGEVERRSHRRASPSAPVPPSRRT